MFQYWEIPLLFIFKMLHWYLLSLHIYHHYLLHSSQVNNETVALQKKCKCPYKEFFFSCQMTTMVFIRDCSPGNGFNVLSPGDWGTQTWDISGKPQALLPIKPRGPLWLCKAVKDIPKIDDQSLYFCFINKYQMSIKCKRYKNRKTCKNVKQKVTQSFSH